MHLGRTPTTPPTMTPELTKPRGFALDATTCLVVYLAFLLVLPAPMRVDALGSAGGPATVFAVAVFFWWLWFHVQRHSPLSGGAQPVRAAMLAWLLIMLVVYAHAMAGALPFDEISPADSGMLRLVGLAGLVLAANDGLASLARTEILVRALVLLVALLSAFALVQFVTGEVWLDRIKIPGLTPVPGAGLGVRSGMVRVSSTSTSPIELSVVLAMVLPLAIALARHVERRRWIYILSTMVITGAAFVSISRSALLCAFVSLGVMSFAWPLVTRMKAAVVALAAGAVAYLTTPGLLGTLGNLFTGAADDSSVQSRIGSYEIAESFIRSSPWLGRGFGTFLPKYRILDNSWLGLLIEGGVLGTVGLLVLVVVAMATALRASRLAIRPIDREIAWACLAAVASGGFGLAFFDGFAFPQTVGIWFLAMGIAGGMRRLSPTMDLSDSDPNARARSARETAE